MATAIRTRPIRTRPLSEEAQPEARIRTRPVTPGNDPEFPINEQHPELSGLQRAGGMSLTGSDPAVWADTLKRQGFETTGEDFGMAIRKPGGKWHRTERTGELWPPSKWSMPELADVTDVAGGAATFAGGLAGASLATAAAAPTTGPGAIAAPAVGFGIGAGATEAGLMGLGKLAGFDPSVGQVAKSAAIEGAIGGVSEVGGRLIGLGVEKGIRALRGAFQGATTFTRKEILDMARGIPRADLPGYAKGLGVPDAVGKSTDELAEAIYQLQPGAQAVDAANAVRAGKFIDQTNPGRFEVSGRSQAEIAKATQEKAFLLQQIDQLKTYKPNSQHAADVIKSEIAAHETEIYKLDTFLSGASGSAANPEYFTAEAMTRGTKGPPYMREFRGMYGQPPQMSFEEWLQQPYNDLRAMVLRGGRKDLAHASKAELAKVVAETQPGATGKTQPRLVTRAKDEAANIRTIYDKSVPPFSDTTAGWRQVNLPGVTRLESERLGELSFERPGLGAVGLRRIMGRTTPFGPQTPALPIRAAQGVGRAVSGAGRLAQLPLQIPGKLLGSAAAGIPAMAPFMARLAQMTSSPKGALAATVFGPGLGPRLAGGSSLVGHAVEGLGNIIQGNPNPALRALAQKALDALDRRGPQAFRSMLFVLMQSPQFRAAMQNE